MMIASLLFASMGVLVKEVETGLPVAYAIFARSLVGLVLSILILRRAGLSWRGKRPGLLAIRGTLGFSALFCNFTSLSLLPLSDAVVLHQTYPIWTAVLAAIFLRERAGARVWVSSIVALVGVTCVVRPSFLFGGEAHVLDALGVALALLAAVFSAGAYVTVRALRKTDDPIVVVFWFALVATPAGVPGVIAEPMWPSPVEVLMLLGIGVAVQAAQMLMTRALHREPAGRVAAVGYLQVVYAFAFGALFFSEPLSALSIVGAILVVAGALFVTLDRVPRPG